MSIKAINFRFNGPTTGITTYNSSVTNLGTLIKQYSGATNEDIYAGPARVALARPFEASTSIPVFYPHVITYSDTIDWVFLADNASGAANRRIVFYEYNKNISLYTWKGFITLIYPTATAHTIRGFRMIRELYTTGDVGVTGNTVTGSGTTWNTDRMCVGSRIGFGSTNPTEITTWYEISSVNSDTTITLTSSVPSNITAGTSYVIEDLMCLTTTTNATATNGGLFVAKGLRVELFTNAGTNIPAATTTDRIRAVYMLADAATLTMTTVAGAVIINRVSWVNQIVYCLNQGNTQVYAYNFRAPLTLTSGRDNTTLTIRTGTQTITGTMSQTNNGRIGTMNHGAGNGVESLYFVTTTRVYRSALSGITTSSTTWISDAMVEIPPGSVNTFPATNALASVEISSSIDKLVVMTTGAGGVRSYITEYNTISSPMDFIFLIDDKQIDQSTADSGIVPHPTINAAQFSVWSEGGVLHLVRIVASASNNMYSIPIGAHQTFAQNTNQMLITPKFDISDSNKLYHVTPKYLAKLGSDTFSIPTEPFNIFYRVSGIDTNTGAWTPLDDYGDLSGVSGSEIQFMFSFKTIGETCVPARIMGLTLTYEDNNTDSHYTPSVGNSSISTNIFAYRQSILWGGSIPNLRIRLYNAVTGSLLIDDDIISSSFGGFQYSTDNGSNWNTWDSSADVVGNYIRYAAVSLPAGVRVRALLTQA
jgi:hypothetical protein